MFTNTPTDHIHSDLWYFMKVVDIFKFISADFVSQAPVVQRLDNAIHRINHYPADKS